MASNTITPDKVKSVLATFLSTNTKDNKKEKNGETESAENEDKEKVMSPIESAAKADYFKRVETYSPMTWFGKPKELSPLVCARYGWENCGPDMLKCVSCHALLCGKLPSTANFDLYKEAIDKLLDKLVSGHERLCWLAANPASERFMILPLYDVARLRKEFHERLCRLAKIKRSLPKLNFENLEKWGCNEEKCKLLAVSQNIREDTSTSATLAITGWTLSETSTDIIECSFCKRRIGLWNYESAETESESKTSPDPDSSDGEPCGKRIKLDKKSALDPLMEHRYWCPWVTMETIPGKEASEESNLASNNDGAVSPPVKEDMTFTLKKNERYPGWVNTLKKLVPGLGDTVGSSGLSQSPMIEGLRSVRKILRVWSSPEKPKVIQPDSSIDHQPDSAKTTSTDS